MCVSSWNCPLNSALADWQRGQVDSRLELSAVPVSVADQLCNLRPLPLWLDVPACLESAQGISMRNCCSCELSMWIPGGQKVTSISSSLDPGRKQLHLKIWSLEGPNKKTDEKYSKYFWPFMCKLWAQEGLCWTLKHILCKWFDILREACSSLTGVKVCMKMISRKHTLESLRKSLSPLYWDTVIPFQLIALFWCQHCAWIFIYMIIKQTVKIKGFLRAKDLPLIIQLNETKLSLLQGPRHSLILNICLSAFVLWAAGKKLLVFLGGNL